MAPVLLRPSLFRTLFFVSIAAGSLVLIDSVLANTERRETALAAARSDRDGQRLMRQGNYADAAEAFRSAIANARDNPEYPLALGQALLSAGKLDEAAATLTDLLKSNSMAGAPNLAMARVLAKKGQFEEAVFYYHRAIYGQWKYDAAASQVATRFELAGLLAEHDSKAELLSELLPLQAQTPTDLATQEKLARLYMTAGSPARAATIFHDLAHKYPQAPEVQAGVGDSELARGDYVAAQAGFIAELGLRPDDQAAGHGLELSDQVLNLDPARRGLTVQERYRRSIQVLQLVAGKTAECLTPAQSRAFANLLDAIQAALKNVVQAARQTDAVESNLELANKLWQVEKSTCTSTSRADKPLELVLAKAAQPGTGLPPGAEVPTPADVEKFLPHHP